MRRLIIEISKEDFLKYEKNELIDKIKTFEIVHLLRFDHSEIAAIMKAELNDPHIAIEELFSNSDLIKPKIQVLEKDKNGAITFFISGKMQEKTEEQKILSFGGYLSPPFEIRDDKIKIAFLGDAKQIKTLLSALEGIGLRFKIVSLTDAKFSIESPLNYLTDKQRSVLTAAFEAGYYETPRRISSNGLAKKLNIKPSTLVEHRRKAEQHLLTQVFKEA